MRLGAVQGRWDLVGAAFEPSPLRTILLALVAVDLCTFQDQANVLEATTLAMLEEMELEEVPRRLVESRYVDIRCYFDIQLYQLHDVRQHERLTLYNQTFYE